MSLSRYDTTRNSHFPLEPQWAVPNYTVEQHVHELDRTQPLAVICASGQRSMMASALLQRHGFTAMANVVGGMEAWNKVEGK